MKTKTYHDGAQEERQAILRKLRKMRSSGTTFTICLCNILIEWLLQRNERYESRKGGLGRKRKAKA